MRRPRRISDESILEAIDGYRAEHRYSPSLRELASAVGMRSLSSLSYRLDALEEEGRILRDRRIPRTLEVVHGEAEPEERA